MKRWEIQGMAFRDWLQLEWVSAGAADELMSYPGRKFWCIFSKKKQLQRGAKLLEVDGKSDWKVMKSGSKYLKYHEDDDSYRNKHFSTTNHFYGFIPSTSRPGPSGTTPIVKLLKTVLQLE